RIGEPPGCGQLLRERGLLGGGKLVEAGWRRRDEGESFVRPQRRVSGEGARTGQHNEDRRRPIGAARIGAGRGPKIGYCNRARRRRLRTGGDSGTAEKRQCRKTAPEGRSASLPHCSISRENRTSGFHGGRFGHFLVRIRRTIERNTDETTGRPHLVEQTR